LAFPQHQGTEEISLPQPQRGTGNGTLARRDADGRRDGKQSEDKAVAPSAQRRQSKPKRGRRSHGKERGKSASGSAQRLRTLKERSGKECDLRKSRSFSDRSRSSPEGPRLQAWFAQRIEQVAVRQRYNTATLSLKQTTALRLVVPIPNLSGLHDGLQIRQVCPGEIDRSVTSGQNYFEISIVAIQKHFADYVA